jgi:hypothetical protein
MSATAESVWRHVLQLSDALDGDRELSERTLDRLFADLKTMPRGGRDEVRRQMILIVAGLARLEVRLTESDGPVQTAV